MDHLEEPVGIPFRLQPLLHFRNALQVVFDLFTEFLSAGHATH